MMATLIDARTVEQHANEVLADSEGLDKSDLKTALKAYMDDFESWYDVAWEHVDDDRENVVKETDESVWVALNDYTHQDAMDELAIDGYSEDEMDILRDALKVLYREQIASEIDHEIYAHTHIHKVPKTHEMNRGEERVNTDLDTLTEVLSPAEAVDYLVVEIQGRRSGKEQADHRGVSKQAVYQNIRDAKETIVNSELAGY